MTFSNMESVLLNEVSRSVPTAFKFETPKQRHWDCGGREDEFLFKEQAGFESESIIG